MIRLSAGAHRFVEAPDLMHLHEGRPPGGPHDRFSCAVANRLLGNESFSGALEFTLLPPQITIEQDCHVCIGGAPSTIQVDGGNQPMWRVLHLQAGSTVRIRLGHHGCRVYFCVAGGLRPDADTKGRYQPAGDPLSAIVGRQRLETRTGQLWTPKRGWVRAMAGPEFTPAMVHPLRHAWRVAARSSGMGLRLEGDHHFPVEQPDITSAPVQDGSVQITAEGPIVLLRERGTLGGYPRAATVIDCDVDRLAQLRPGDHIRFELVDERAAAKWCGVQYRSLRQVVG